MVLKVKIAEKNLIQKVIKCPLPRCNNLAGNTGSGTVLVLDFKDVYIRGYGLPHPSLWHCLSYQMSSHIVGCGLLRWRPCFLG